MPESFRRFLFGNLILKPSNRIIPDRYVMINLYSFRRKVLTEGQFLLLMSFYNHITFGQFVSDEAKRFYYQMLAEKQILSDETIQHYDSERKRLIDAKLNEVKPLINRITISPTYLCNFNCVYCYQRDFADKKHVMTEVDIDQIIDYVCYINQNSDYQSDIQTVSINGGETCLPQNVKIINYIFQKFSHNEECKFELFTNGATIVDVKNKIDFSRFDRIQVSLDGDAKIFERINGVSGDLFKKVIDGIVYLSRVTKSVELACVVTRELISDFDSIYNAFKDHRLFDIPNVSFRVSPPSCFATTTVDGSFMSIKELAAFDEKIKRDNKTERFPLSSIYELRNIVRALSRESSKDMIVTDTTCTVLERRSLMFSPDGNTYWCVCGQQDRGIIGKYSMPTSKDIDTIKNYVHRTVHNIDECSKCDLKYVCTGGCPLYAVVKHDDPMKCECGLFKDKEFIDNMEDYIW